MTYEVLRTVVFAKRNSSDPLTSAERFASGAMRSGALATDILEDANSVIINTLWPTEGRWDRFRKAEHLRKKKGKELWTKHFK